MKTFFKNTKLIAALVAAPMMALASASQAETVLIDFSTNVPAPAVADSNGNRWNSFGPSGSNVAPIPATALIDTTGASVPWQIAYLGSGTTGTGFGGAGINGNAGPAPLDQSFAVIDGVFSNANSGGLVTFTFTGLAANSVYNLSMIGGRATSGEDGVVAVTTGTGTGGALLNDGTVLNFAATSDGTGTLAFTFLEGPVGAAKTGQASFNGSTLNAMSITGTTIPEPTSLALLGLGGLLVARRRRG